MIRKAIEMSIKEEEATTKVMGPDPQDLEPKFEERKEAVHNKTPKQLIEISGKPAMS